MLSRVLTHFQTGLLLAVVVLCVSPIALPDLLGLGSHLSWALVALGASVAICVPELLRGGWTPTRLDPVLALYVVLVGAGGLASVDGWQTIKASTLLAGDVGLFYAAVVVARRSTRGAAGVLSVLIVGAAAIELAALAYHIEAGIRSRPAVYPIPEGWSGYPELGSLAVLQLGAIAGLVIGAERAARKIPAAVLGLVAAAEILLLYSRGAWAAAGVIVLAGVPLARASKRTLLLLGAALVFVAGMVIALSPTIRFLADNALTGRTDRAVEGAAIGAAAPEYRFQIWGKTLGMIRDRPWTGVGLGNFRSVFERDYNPELNNDQRRGVHAHNLWLHTAADVGIPAAVCYVAFWVGALWIAGRSAVRRRSVVTLGVFLAIVGAAASNLTDSVPSQTAGTRVFLLTWVLLGLGAAAPPDPPEP